MMKSLRLLFSDYNRACKGCYNKDWVTDELEIETDYSGYDEIMLTGGEPMLKPYFIKQVIDKIKQQNTHAKIYLYTATVSDVKMITYLLEFLDGLTVTLHSGKESQQAIREFNTLDDHLIKTFHPHIY